MEDLWTCPRCGKRFVNRNNWHSCGTHTVDDFMAGKSEAAWAYWNRLREMVRECGPHEIVANKTRLAFMVRVRFAGMTAVSDRGMSFSFWLKERIHSDRFQRVEHISGRDWEYRVRVTSLDDLDGEVQTWLCKAYLVGRQEA